MFLVLIQGQKPRSGASHLCHRHRPLPSARRFPHGMGDVVVPGLGSLLGDKASAPWGTLLKNGSQTHFLGCHG